MPVKAPDDVRVDFACNDPDNGLFAGRVGSIHIYDQDPVIELESTGADRKIAIEPGGFRLAGRVFEHHGHRTWIGNWAWDGLWMTVDEAARMLAWLHRRQLFQLTTGESGLHQQWRERTPFGGPHLLRTLAAAGLWQRGHR
jgi:hypothetical protein